jgi:hypothetical protein
MMTPDFLNVGGVDCQEAGWFMEAGWIGGRDLHRKFNE